MNSTANPTLSPKQRQTARATLRDVSLAHRSDADLDAELTERINTAALYQVRLDEGDYTDEDEADRLRGGIAYELAAADRLVTEMQRRQRATRYGYRATGVPENDLSPRFARQREGGALPLADLIGELTNQPGRRTGDHWRFVCPFHGNGQERTASLTVFPDGRAHCFSCAWRGDAADFVAEVRGIGSVEALRLIEKGLI